MVHGKGGDDTISVAGALHKRACLIGGTGNDLLQAGAGDDILVGGMEMIPWPADKGGIYSSADVVPTGSWEMPTTTS